MAWGWFLLAVIGLVCALRAQLERSPDTSKPIVWSGWPESSELRRPAYAERIHPDHWIRTVANTWSNLAYVLVGFYGFAYGWRDWRRRQFSKSDAYLCKTPVLSLGFGAACCYLGFGSGLFHASLTRFGQQLDVAAMYAPLMLLIVISACRLLPVCHRWPTWPFAMACVAVASWFLFVFKWQMSSTNVLTTLILAVGILALAELILSPRQVPDRPIPDRPIPDRPIPDRPAPMYRRPLRWLFLSSCALIAAVFCRQMDIAGRFSGPDSLLQGHAFWHILTAFSLLCAYAYQREI